MNEQVLARDLTGDNQVTVARLMSRGYHPPPGARAHLAAWDDSTAGGHLPATDYGLARGEGLPRAPTSYYTYYRAITYYTRPYLVWAAREEILPAASIECDRLVRYVSWLSPLPGLPAAAAQGRLLLRCGGRCGGRAPILHLGRASSGLLIIAHACCVRPILVPPAYCGHTYCGHTYYGHTYRSTTAQVFEFDGSTFSSTYELQGFEQNLCCDDDPHLAAAVRTIRVL